MTASREHDAFARDIVVPLRNGDWWADGFAAKVVDHASRATANQVLGMLATESWRERSVGAWFALVHGRDAGVPAALHESLRGSRGRLTAPHLSTAATLLNGANAIPALLDYGSKDVAHTWGMAGFITAVIEELGMESPLPAATDDDRDFYNRHRKLAREIHALAT